MLITQEQVSAKYRQVVAFVEGRTIPMFHAEIGLEDVMNAYAYGFGGNYYKEGNALTFYNLGKGDEEANLKWHFGKNLKWHLEHEPLTIIALHSIFALPEA